MYSKCLICGGDFEKIVLNSLLMRRCVSCGLVWRENFDLEKDYYEKGVVVLGEEKMEARRRNCLDRMRIIKKWINLDNLCDIGCGEGSFIKELKKGGYKNVIGIDPSLEAIKFALGSGEEVFLGNLDEALSLIKDKKIEVITMFHVIEHLENPLESVEKIRKVLPDRGCLIIETPDFQSFSLLVSNFKYSLINPEHLFYFNEFNLKKLLQKAGFTVKNWGRRDFDQWNMGIGESLKRLGWGTRGENKDGRYDGDEEISRREKKH